MKYLILIIVGIAGIVLGTYLGRRRVVKKGKLFSEASLDSTRDKQGRQEN